MDIKVEAGQLWVNAKIRDLANRKNAFIQAFEWEEPDRVGEGGFLEACYTLAVWNGGRRKVIPFLANELAEVEGSPELQYELFDRLEKALQGSVDVSSNRQS